MGAVRSCQSGAKLPEMATPLFTAAKTLYLLNRLWYRHSEAFRMFRIAMFRGIIVECKPVTQYFMTYGQEVPKKHEFLGVKHFVAKINVPAG